MPEDASVVERNVRKSRNLSTSLCLAVNYEKFRIHRHLNVSSRRFSMSQEDANYSSVGCVPVLLPSLRYIDSMRFSDDCFNRRHDADTTLLRYWYAAFCAPFRLDT